MNTILDFKSIKYWSMVTVTKISPNLEFIWNKLLNFNNDLREINKN